MSFWDWFRNEPTQLKLDAGDMGRSRVTLPRVPLDVSPDSTWKYSRKSELVYACIEKKAQAACDPELIVERKNSQNEWETVPDHPATMVFNKPNPFEDGESFLRAWIAAENTAGIAYFEKVTSRAGQLVELYPLIPTLMTPMYKRVDAGEAIEYYEYQSGSGVPVRFQPDELLIRRRHSLGSMFTGLSPLQVALGPVDADLAATEYVRAFFNNDGTPSGILKVNGRRMSDDDALHLRQMWQINYSRYGKNRGGVAVLDESADYEPIGAKLNELESETLTSIDETRICMAFGVPPVLIGAYVGLKNVNQKASFEGALKEFWMNTMSPELRQIRTWMTWFVLPYFENVEAIKAGKIRFNWDLTQVDAMQEDLDSIHARIREDYKAGLMTLNEARDAIQMTPVEGDEGDTFYSAPTIGEPPTAEEMPPKSLPDNVHLLNGSKKNFTYEGLDLRREPSDIEKAIDLKAVHDSFERGRESLAKVIQTMRTDLIKEAGQEIRDYRDRDVHTLTLSPPPYAAKSITRELKRAVEAGRAQVAADATRAGKSEPLFDAKGIIDDLLKILVDATISQIINEIASGAINIYTALRKLGYDADDIADELEARLDERSDKTFDRIAAQSVNVAVNIGRREEMRERADDIDRYVYSAILDKNTCDNCEEWDGKEAQDTDDLPETPNPECEGMSNCRCFVVAVFGTEAV